MEVSGSIVDLLHFVHGLSFDEISTMFSSGLSDYEGRIATTRKEEEDTDNTKIVKEELKKYPNFDLSPPSNYLSLRGISIEAMRYFDIGASEDTMVLPLYRRRQGKWVAQTSIKYMISHDGRVRYFQKGLQRRGSYSILKEKDRPLKGYTKALLFESPIDALSYFQLFGVEGLYVSTCGNLTNELISSLPLDLKNIGIKKTTIAFDNDDAGDRMTKKISRALEDSGLEVEVEKPKEKDWNDAIMISKKY
ncbi:MAG: toprim domain-containing protein [Chlamydiota bacterium]